MSSYRHLFFDLDHTLWDFERNSREALVELHQQFGIDAHGIPVERFIEKYFEVNTAMWELYHLNRIDRTTLRHIRFDKTFEYFRLADDKILDTFPEAYLELLPTKKNLFPDSLEVLSSLRKRFALHLITNGFRSVQENKLRLSGLVRFFDVVVISEMTGFKKPEKGIFEFAGRQAGTTPDQSLMIGDDQEADINGAVNAGWDAVLFNPEKREVSCRPTYEIERLSELESLL